MLSARRWRWVLLAAFIIGVSIPFLLRVYEKYQRLKTVRQFAYAIQTGDYKTATQLVLEVERQQLGVTPEAMGRAFELLHLMPLRFAGIKDETVSWPIVFVKTRWQKEDGGEESVFVETMKEKGKWKVNFFFTFRRFCSLKLLLQGWDKVKAFQESRPWAMRILKTAGIKGYVSDFGTVRSFEGEMKGIVTP